MDRHKEAFRELKSRLEEDYPSVEKVVLFGSVARGSYGVNSDVDVLILVKDLLEREEIENLAFRTASKHGVSITPVIVEQGEETSLTQTVEKEGVSHV